MFRLMRWPCALIMLLAASAQAAPTDAGQALLKSKGCLACHSLDGSAGVGPTLKGIIEGRGVEHVRRSITDPGADITQGFGAGMMPTVSLSEVELQAILAALAVPVAAEGQPAKGSILMVALGALLFILLHLLLSSGWLRPRLVARLGEGRFQLLYSVLAIVALTGTWMAWEGAPYVELWAPWPWTRWVPNIGMPFVCILFCAGYAADSPTIAGKADALGNEDPATGILRITRHPANIAFTLWGLLHIPPNGDLATLWLIFAFVGLGIFGTWHIERRRLASHGEAWRAFAQKTSIVPFAAVLRGQQHLSLAEIGWRPILIGLGAWLVLLLTHVWVMGASPFPIF